MKKILFIIIFVFLFSLPCFAKTVAVSWDENSEPDLDYYVVSWGSVSGVYTSSKRTEGIETTLFIDIPDSGLSYVAIKAVDTSGLESPYSIEIIKGEVIEGPPVLIGESKIVDI